MLKDVKQGLASYAKAHDLIMKEGLWKYALVPGIVFCLLFVGVAYLGFKLSDVVVGYVENIFDLEQYDMVVIIWLIKIVKFILSFFVKSFFWVMFFWGYKNFLLIIMSPLFAFLSEKTATIITGESVLFDLRQFVKDVGRGVLLSSRNIIIELVILFALTLFSSIPIIGLIGFIFIFLLQSYFFGFAMIDYSNERKKLTMTESIKFVRNNKMMAVVNGAIFFLLFAIPLIGWALAPIYAVVAATVATTEKDIELKKLKEKN
ncbi:MAG: EI24 domain-containing protein [Flavobacteriales bacterium]|nr:EI24 domain-containing protein [Flavobacteriales bacterium]